MSLTWEFGGSFHFPKIIKIPHLMSACSQRRGSFFKLCNMKNGGIDTPLDSSPWMEVNNCQYV